MRAVAAIQAPALIGLRFAGVRASHYCEQTEGQESVTRSQENP